MRLLITAGPTREPIDPVRFISNRSSGQMGVALADAALAARHSVTVISGPVQFAYPPAARVIAIETTRQMYDAVLAELPSHDALVMAAAVADFRPRQSAQRKLTRAEGLTLELEPTEDIVAAAAQQKSPQQRIIGFSLEADGDVERARQKLQRKRLDLIVFNPLRTMNAPDVAATLLFADGSERSLPDTSKGQFAHELIAAVERLIAQK